MTRTANEEAAYNLGAQHAKNAASWVVDGNTSESTISALLDALVNGDPAGEQFLPTAPNLSGEWADDLTPTTLYEEITGKTADPDINGLSFETDHGHELDKLANAYEEGVSDTFEGECERILRAALPAPDLDTVAGAVAYLTAGGTTGHLGVPCSRYGRNSEECAPVAFEVARIIGDANGEPITEDDLDHAMGLVVNDSDEVESLIREHGDASLLDD